MELSRTYKTSIERHEVDQTSTLYEAAWLLKPLMRKVIKHNQKELRRFEEHNKYNDKVHREAFRNQHRLLKHYQSELKKAWNHLEAAERAANKYYQIEGFGKEWMPKDRGVEHNE